MTISIKSKSSVNVGVDVGKDTLDICIHEKALHWQEANTPEGVMRSHRRICGGDQAQDDTGQEQKIDPDQGSACAAPSKELEVRPFIVQRVIRC